MPSALQVGIVLPHDGVGGGVTRLRKIGRSLQERGHDVSRCVSARIDAAPRASREPAGDVTRSLGDVARFARGLDVLICPGDFPAYCLIPWLPRTCSVYSFHLHLGMHDWKHERGNILCPDIRKATTARWIQAEI